jgi:hypothetical protein
LGSNQDTQLKVRVPSPRDAWGWRSLTQNWVWDADVRRRRLTRRACRSLPSSPSITCFPHTSPSPSCATGLKDAWAPPPALNRGSASTVLPSPYCEVPQECLRHFSSAGPSPRWRRCGGTSADALPAQEATTAISH